MTLKWNKKGLVFGNDKLPEWADNSALTPTPIVLNEDVVRVYCGFRDKFGVSRIGYVDLSTKDPSIVLAVSREPVLDIGRHGCFDDNGVFLGDVVLAPDGNYRMYYVGFQIVKNAKFLAFTGLAISKDGEKFTRISEAPILDRTNGAATIRAIHSIRFDGEIWHAWYAVGDDWETINGVDFPRYNIWHTSSEDGVNFSSNATLCVDLEGDEYRIGRPSVFRRNDTYAMFYTKGGLSGKDYFPGIAYSEDGLVWNRRDEDLGLVLGMENEFDSQHLCYPRLFVANGKSWVVYNGNYMGAEGFGVAELIGDNI